MPRLHGAEADRAHCAGQTRRSDVWVVDTRQGFGYLVRTGQMVDAVYLDAAIRGRGWGALLLEQAMWKRDRLSLWTFQENRAAIRFYEAQGFKVTDLTDGAANEEKLPDARLLWERGTV